jgi:hypothetical protein
MKLPKIIKDRMDLQINEQVTITLFPDDEGQPKCDIIKLSMLQLEGNKIELFFTPCEVMELASAFTQTVQFYLYNQQQYRAEVLSLRNRLAAKRLRKNTAQPLTGKCSHNAEK